MGIENVKKIQTTNFVIVWGGNLKLRGGGDFPPKGPEKKHCLPSCPLSRVRLLGD